MVTISAKVAFRTGTARNITRTETTLSGIQDQRNNRFYESGQIRVNSSISDVFDHKH
jgi:hypothetical protein